MKIKSLLVSIMLSVLLLTSCKRDNEENPSPATGTLTPASEVPITAKEGYITFTANGTEYSSNNPVIYDYQTSISHKGNALFSSYELKDSIENLTVGYLNRVAGDTTTFSFSLYANINKKPIVPGHTYLSIQILEVWLGKLGALMGFYNDKLEGHNYKPIDEKGSVFIKHFDKVNGKVTGSFSYMTKGKKGETMAEDIKVTGRFNNINFVKE